MLAGGVTTVRGMPDSNYKTYSPETKAEALWLTAKRLEGTISAGPGAIAKLLGIKTASSIRIWVTNRGTGNLPEVPEARQRELLALVGVEQPEPEPDNLPVVIEPPKVNNHNEEVDGTDWEQVSAYNELIHLRLSHAQQLIRIGELERRIEELTEKLEAAYVRAQDDVAATKAAADMRIEAEGARADHYLQTITYMVEEIRRHA